jgi:hypothetical protein
MPGFGLQRRTWLGLPGPYETQGDETTEAFGKGRGRNFARRLGILAQQGRAWFQVRSRFADEAAEDAVHVTERVEPGDRFLP